MYSGTAAHGPLQNQIKGEERAGLEGQALTPSCHRGGLMHPGWDVSPKQVQEAFTGEP